MGVLLQHIAHFCPTVASKKRLSRGPGHLPAQALKNYLAKAPTFIFVYP
jgi:hypothetical protein